VAEPDSPVKPTSDAARRSSALWGKLAENPLVVLMLVSQLGIGGATLGSAFSRPSESELRLRWEAARVEDVADADARAAATKCAADAQVTSENVTDLTKSFNALSKRVDDVFAFQGEIHEGMRSGFVVFGRALKVAPPEPTPAAIELRAKSLLRYQRGQFDEGAP
jgi:hypothetical protein